MAIEKIITIDVDLNNKEAVKATLNLTEVIQEQKEITIEFQRELIQLERKLKETPKNALSAQKKLKKEIVGLKDAIKDQRISLKELNIEKQKGGVVTKNLTDQVSKNYGVTSLLNQLTGGLASRYRDAYTAVTGLSTGLKGLKGALLATGVGAAVVLVGLLVKNWEKVKTVLSGVTKEQQALNVVLKESSGAATDFRAKLASVNGQIDLAKKGLLIKRRL